VLFGVHGEYGNVILLFPNAVEPVTATSRNKTEALIVRETTRTFFARQAQAAATAIPMKNFQSRRRRPIRNDRSHVERLALVFRDLF